MKKRILFSVFCLIACMGTKAAESADTTRVYYINGEQITGFDGTQLVGALVSDYVISHEEHPSQKGVIVEKHTRSNAIPFSLFLFQTKLYHKLHTQYHIHYPEHQEIFLYHKPYYLFNASVIAGITCFFLEIIPGRFT